MRVRAGRADAEQRRGLPLALGQRQDFVGVTGHDADFVEDREREVEPFEPLGLSGQADERRATLGHVQPVLVDTDPGGQVLVQLDHAGGGAEHDSGLPLVGRGDHDGRAFLTEHEVVQTERGDERGLALTSRHHPPGEHADAG